MLKYFYYNIDCERYLILGQQKYLHLPLNNILRKKNGLFVFEAVNKEALQFKLNKLVKEITKPFIKKLLLKGLGLRVNFSVDMTFLEFKLGFSHLIRVKIPSGISIKIYKNTIAAYSSNHILLGNFCYSLRNLKKPNAYKGKGLWYKNETRVLKIVKKT